MIALIGWLKLHREIRGHWLYPSRRKYTEYEAWLDLLIRTNWQNGKAKIDKTLIEVKRGQFITSQLKLSYDWLWSRTEIRSFLKMLEQDEMIVKQSTSKYTMITICNFESYQDNSPLSNHQATNGKTSSEQQGDTIEEEKEEKKKKSMSSFRSQDLAYLDGHRQLISCSDKTFNKTPNSILVDNVIASDDIEKDNSNDTNRRLRMVKWMHEQVGKRFGFTSKWRNAKLLDWLEQIRLLIEKEQLTPGKFAKVLNFAFDNAFWCKVARSPSGFIKNYDGINADFVTAENKKQLQ